jgi:hypothetical protein
MSPECQRYLSCVGAVAQLIQVPAVGQQPSQLPGGVPVVGVGVGTPAMTTESPTSQGRPHPTFMTVISGQLRRPGG